MSEPEGKKEFDAFIKHLLANCNNDGEILVELSALYERDDISNIFTYLPRWRAKRIVVALFDKDWEVDDILDVLLRKWPRQKAINTLIPLLHEAYLKAQDDEPNRQWTLLRELLQCTTKKERIKAIQRKPKNTKHYDYDETFLAIIFE